MKLVVAAAAIAIVSCRAPAPAPVAPAPDPACDGHDGLVAVPREPIAAHWNGGVRTGGTGALEVHYCGAGAVTLRRIEVGDSARWVRELEPDRSRLARGAAITVDVPGRPDPGTAPVEVIATDGAGRELRATATLTSVEDPARAAARAACTQCGGDWGAAGMLGREMCDCPTHDAGKVCTSDADCESDCEPERFEPVAGLTCPAGQRGERLVGRCRARTLHFGCHPSMGDGQPHCQPIGMAHALPSVCSD